jgi:hypothetical protein
MPWGTTTSSAAEKALTVQDAQGWWTINQDYVVLVADGIERLLGAGLPV